MKSTIGSRHLLVVIIGAFALTAILILGLNAPRPGAREEAHSQAMHRMAPPPHHDNPLIRDLVTSAISISQRL